MAEFNLKPTHKLVKAYFDGLARLEEQGIKNEGAVAPLFADLLRHCAQKAGYVFADQQPFERLRFDGVVLSKTGFTLGVWEAKDTQDDLKVEIGKKFARGYPKENILFQSPDEAVLYQDGQPLFEGPIATPDALVELLELFFRYEPPAFENWEKAVEQFKEKVPELGRELTKLIEKERKANKAFIDAFAKFLDLCREAINPNLAESAVEEMLIQHILTERLFHRVFNNPDFAARNIIAREIETVIQALTSHTFSRQDFLQPLDRFYLAIEEAAGSLHDWAEKQTFMNTVYEQFFQGFSVKAADTHGIVYTPQPIVEFMVRSVNEILQEEFGKTLGDPGVSILDPFVGTGNFILRVMREIPKSRLAQKYASELHCNEVMLLPYYIASMNIEHEYFAQTGQYKPFEGICLVDTFELAEPRQTELAFMTKENTARVKKQKQAPIFVILGNPPYNAHQVNENDNNRNRRYPVVEGRVRDTYAKDSKATNKNALSDAYVKAFRWASDRIGKNGLVAFVSNNSYLDDFSFDGMRKHLGQDFNRIYVMDLKGNIRKDSMRDGIPLGERHTVFGLAAMVGVTVAFFVRSAKRKDHRIEYASVDFRSTREEKFWIIDSAQTIGHIAKKQIVPDANHTWLTHGLRPEWRRFAPIGTKEAKAGKADAAIFRIYSRGAETTRDSWVYSFQMNPLVNRIQAFIETYNTEVDRWPNRSNRNIALDDFVISDETRIKWSSRLKECLLRHQKAEYSEANLRHSLYRPFCKQFLYFDSILTHRQGQFPRFYPTPKTEGENRVICLSAVGNSRSFHCLATDRTPDLHFTGDSQCFPFYTYDEDGTNRRENITDWALEQFRRRYKNTRLTKWDIFHYVYGLLHHPSYRKHYEANLKKELPRLPFAPDFAAFAKAGKKLAELHVHYDQQKEYPLKQIENPDRPLNWRVEKMKLSKDRTQIIYNDFLTLAGVPPEVFDYKLGNRSALHWVIDQHQVTVDPRSGIENDPNRPDDPEYIVRLIKQVVTVSLETLRIVKDLPDL